MTGTGTGSWALCFPLFAVVPAFFAPTFLVVPPLQLPLAGRFGGGSASGGAAEGRSCPFRNLCHGRRHLRLLPSLTPWEGDSFEAQWRRLANHKPSASSKSVGSMRREANGDEIMLVVEGRASPMAGTLGESVTGADGGGGGKRVVGRGGRKGCGNGFGAAAIGRDGDGDHGGGRGGSGENGGAGGHV